MKAVLIFDNLNDLLFHKWDDTFLDRMKSFAEEINPAHQEDGVTNSYNVAQLLSPIITSQRVMGAQFGNTYTSMQCQDGTNIVFDELLDHVLMIVSEDDIEDSHRELLDCKTFVQHLCGQNVNMLHSSIYQQWLSALLEAREAGDSIPGASGVIGESGATAAALNALKGASKEIKCRQPFHMVMFVGDKLLALYSSRGAEDLSPPDIILARTQSAAAQLHWRRAEDRVSTNSHLPWLSEENSAIVMLLSGSGGGTGAVTGGGAGAGVVVCPHATHALHVAAAAPGLTLVVLVDMGGREVGAATHMSSQILCNLRKLLLQRNLELLPATLDSLETSIKKLTEALRKNKSNANLCARLTSRMTELRKSCSTTTPLTPETTATAMHTALEVVSDQLRPDIPSLNMEPPLQEIRAVLTPYVDFLRVKAMRCFGLASGAVDSDKLGSLTLNKYVEEFPGLVHFVYVDRTTGRFLAPDMADCVEMLTPKMVRGCVSRVLALEGEGYCAGSWRAAALHYCFVLWWEKGETAVKPKDLHPAAVRALPPPGDILGTFYRQLTEQSFPSPAGVNAKELICVHLGLIPPATAIEQARRLAATVKDVASMGDTSDLL